MHSITIQDLPYRSDSETLFSALRDLPDAIWLDSGKPRSLQGRFDIISASPDALIETRGALSIITDNNGTVSSAEDPFTLVERLLAPLLDVDPSMSAHPFVGGIMGYFGYDLGRRLVEIPDRTKSIADLPDMRIGRYLWSLVINHSAQQTQLFFHELCPEKLSQDIIQRLSQVDITVPKTHFRLREPFKPTLSPEQYRQSVASIKRYIDSGDCYQTNFTQHFSTTFDGDPYQAYLVLRDAVPSPYSAFLQWQDKALLSVSPERFVKSSVGNVETKPIKGTLLRGTTVQEDQDNAVALLNSNKDCAENLMIVDLLRNDLGKTCVPGSIRVPKLFALESFPNVHHLVSTVTGLLADQHSVIDLLRGCFPGGSITGAPKKRAMEIIEELEPVKRSVYCGSIGYISATGRMDTNIAIRTMVADANTLHCWGGGGIVADSEAECEYQESINKIKLLLSALENLA